LRFPSFQFFRLPHFGHFTFGLLIPVKRSSEMNAPHFGHLFVVLLTSCQTCERMRQSSKQRKKGEKLRRNYNGDIATLSEVRIVSTISGVRIPPPAPNNKKGLLKIPAFLN
jgi:hypothetical protein